MKIDGDSIHTVRARVGLGLQPYLQQLAERVPLPAPVLPAVQLVPPLRPIVWRGSWAIECPYCPSMHRYTPGECVAYCLNPECPRPHAAAFLVVADWPVGTAARACEVLLHRTAEVVDRRTGVVQVGADDRPALQALVHTRSWLPPRESVADLERENRQHGHEVPV